MTCSCGHTPHQHDDTGCKVTILTGWSEKIQHFTGHRDCICTEYSERVRPAAVFPTTECPVTGHSHEVAPDQSPNCVHCNLLVPENRLNR